MIQSGKLMVQMKQFQVLLMQMVIKETEGDGTVEIRKSNDRDQQNHERMLV